MSDERTVWHPVFGEYVMDDPAQEHRDGEHEVHPDPESCPECARLEVEADCGCGDLDCEHPSHRV